jgi:hypothetical protein
MKRGRCSEGVSAGGRPTARGMSYAFWRYKAGVDIQRQRPTIGALNVCLTVVASLELGRVRHLFGGSG